ncbi:MAG: DNA-directed RNA polymerase subunit alpha [Candidatus Pacebacteria bacterium]|nr:DNA-directed RNA polymerase subunit alpha [Candidatus Paceibacterota bacterium]
MRYDNLSETVSIKRISEDQKNGVFEIDGLYSGYGITVGNALRRILLSSLPGAAITQVKIKGVSHEFSTISGVQEDVVEILLNLKRIRFKMWTDEPQVLSLKEKGEGVISASMIKSNSQVEVVNGSELIATITDKHGEVDMEITVEKGLGYVPSEARKAQKLGVGIMAIDSIFTPVISVNFSIENMRVEDKTDYNKLKISIETDGTVTPSFAIKRASEILESHFKEVAKLEILGEKPPKKEGDEVEKSEDGESTEKDKKAPKKAKKAKK